MSTTSFADVDKEAKDQPAEPKAEVATTQSTGLTTHADGSGGLASEDLNIDHIQILGKSSQFDPEGGSIGDICINKETPLANVDEPLKVVLVHAQKYWKENVPYGDDTIPRFANTLDEKKAIESSTEFDGTVPVCDVTVLIERPESFTDDEAAAGIFLYSFGGKEYALAKYTVQKSQAVRENYGTLNVVSQARKTNGADAADYYFELVSKEKGAGTKYKWHQFVLKGSTSEAPEEAVGFARSLRGE